MKKKLKSFRLSIESIDNFKKIKELTQINEGLIIELALSHFRCVLEEKKYDINSIIRK